MLRPIVFAKISSTNCLFLTFLAFIWKTPSQLRFKLTTNQYSVWLYEFSSIKSKMFFFHILYKFNFVSSIHHQNHSWLPWLVFIYKIQKRISFLSKFSQCLSPLHFLQRSPQYSTKMITWIHHLFFIWNMKLVIIRQFTHLRCFRSKIWYSCYTDRNSLVNSSVFTET